MDDIGERGLLGENFSGSKMVRARDGGYDSRLGSENFEGVSGDDQDLADEQPKKKKYHRHTPHQIQELENVFKQWPHPDEKQRTELSRRLGLGQKQVKFWFQNRRTQMKTQLERSENIILKQENDKLQAENGAMKEAIANPICKSCGGPAVLGQVLFEEHQLNIENVRLRDEINRICILTNKFLGRSISSVANPISLSTSFHSDLELAVGRNGFNASPIGLDIGDGVSVTSSGIGRMVSEIPFERTVFVDLALGAADELVKMAQLDSPLWIKSLDGEKETLNYEEYTRMFSPCIGAKPNGFVSEATRDTTEIIINSLAFVEMLMDVNRWTEMFPCFIARASIIDVISSGIDGTRNGTIQLMYAELRALSPLVPARPFKFIRFCKQHSDGVWEVVDVSIDTNQEGPNAQPCFNCRRRPSGCVAQDMPNGYSKVTWVEHTEYDENAVHQLFQPLIRSGMGFGAQRWLATLQRQCDCLAILMSSNIPSGDPTAMTPSGRRSMLKLAQRMVDNFCSGVCASTTQKWNKLCLNNVGENVRMMTRKSVDVPGEPPGIILSAATSIWMPVTQQKLFDFLRDERLRNEWDILSNGGAIQEMVHIAKGSGQENCVSLLQACAVNSNESTMFVLQETWTDPTGSLIVYAPVDIPSINLVMHGGDSAFVSLLPSGFSILPNGCNRTPVMNNNGNETDGGGCLLTVGFQILVNSLPTAKLTVESVETVNHLISCTIQKIKTAFQKIDGKFYGIELIGKKVKMGILKRGFRVKIEPHMGKFWFGCYSSKDLASWFGY